jgi:hypothetical protein
MGQHDVEKQDGIANRIFTDAEMTETFGGQGVTPVNAALVVIEEG